MRERRRGRGTSLRTREDAPVLKAPAFEIPEPGTEAAAFAERTREAFLDLVGRTPFPKPPALNPEVVSETDAGAYIRRKVRYGNATDDVVWAWLLIPKELSAPTPAVVCLPGSFMTPNWGKDAPAGLAGPLVPGNPEAYGVDLANRGYVTLCPDYPCAGERTSPGLRSHDTTELDKRFPEWSRMGLSTRDVSRAVDFLLTVPEVDPQHVGCTGWSQGGLTTVLGAAMDTRISVAVSACGWAPLRGRDPTGYLASYNFPRLRQYVEEARTAPFDLDHMAALIAPRPLLNVNAANDHYVPNRGELAAAEATLARYYRSLGARERFKAIYVPGDHAYTDEVARASQAWFDRWLRPNTSAMGHESARS